MTIEIGEGPLSDRGTSPCISLTDAAYSLVEPVLERVAPRYLPGVRWSYAEIAAPVWHEVTVELAAVVERLDRGERLRPSDVSWVHTVDLDSDREIASKDFLDWLNDAEHGATVRATLASIATWLEAALTRVQVLTIYGY